MSQVSPTKQQGDLVGLYTYCLDRLRSLRSLGAPENAQDAIYDEMDGLWECMTQAQKEEAEKMSWRAWPETYDERTKT